MNQLRLSFIKFFRRGRLVALLLPVVFLVACGESPDEELTKIAPPPDIPAPPKVSEEVTKIQPLPSTNVTGQQRATLQKALKHAVELELLDAKASVALLRQPVTRGEFAFWLAGFQKIRPVENPIPTFEDVPPDHPFYTAIESVTTARMLKGKMHDGALRFFPDQTINREELAHLYTRLTGQAEDAENSDAVAYDGMHPPSALGARQNFEHFMDYEQIAPSYRGHVARAYRDNVLYKTFGLTPKALVTLKGFHPAAPVTRLEALLFLETSFED